MLLFMWLIWFVLFDGVDVVVLWGFVYVLLFSMLIGFVFWYCGLVFGGIVGVG